MKKLTFYLAIAMLLTMITGSSFSFADEAHSEVAGFVQIKEVLREGMEPVFAKDLNDGTYEIQANSSSSFFKIMNAKLTVKGDKMEAEMVMYTNSYSDIFMGSGEEAAKAEESQYLHIEDNGKEYTLTVPVEALSSRIPCATFSKKKQLWYDRNLCFDASSLPQTALKTELSKYGDLMSEGEGEAAKKLQKGDPQKEAMEVDFKDGEYSIEVTLAGGSGRASVSSPTWLYVKNGKAFVKLLWSSSYYDYMIVDDMIYYNETTDGSNSSFTIPLPAFDRDIKVIADTTAMGDPVEIEYTLTFYEDTIGNKGQVPQEATKRVIAIAAVIIIGGGILNLIIKKKRGR